MYDELNFRNQQGDGKIALTAAAIGIAASAAIAWLGWPAVYAGVGACVALIGYKICKA